MANDKQPQENIERVRDLLSPYLDDEISTEERALVEQAIAGSSELRRELETLRQTVSLVAALPPVPAPRPFTLSEANVRPAQPPARRGFFSLPIWVGSAALVAATLICVVAIGGVFFSGLFGAGQLAPVSEVALQQDQAASESAPAEAPAAAESTAEEAPAAEESFREESEPAQAMAPAVEEPTGEESAEMMAEQEAEAGAANDLMVEKEAEAPESEAMEAEAMEAPAEEEAAPTAENRSSAGNEADTLTEGAGEAAAATASASPPTQTALAPAPTAVMQATSVAEAQAAPATADEAAPPVDRDEALKLPPEIASESADDNGARPVPTPTPPPTSTPAPTVTVIARLEPAAPIPTAIPETGQTTVPSPAPASQNRPARLIITAIALILGLLVIIGLIGFWWIVRKQRG